MYNNYLIKQKTRAPKTFYKKIVGYMDISMYLKFFMICLLKTFTCNKYQILFQVVSEWD